MAAATRSIADPAPMLGRPAPETERPTAANAPRPRATRRTPTAARSPTVAVEHSIAKPARTETIVGEVARIAAGRHLAFPRRAPPSARSADRRRTDAARCSIAATHVRRRAPAVAAGRRTTAA